MKLDEGDGNVSCPNGERSIIEYLSFKIFVTWENKERRSWDFWQIGWRREKNSSEGELIASGSRDIISASNVLCGIIFAKWALNIRIDALE